MTNTNLRNQAASHQTVLTTTSADGFGIYHDLIQSSGATASRLGDTFETSVTACNFGRLTLFDRQVVGAEHSRDHRHIRRDDFGHYYLQVLRSGRLMCGPSGHERQLAPGDAVLFDATQPMRARAPSADYVTVILARDLVEAAAPDARRLHGRILPTVGQGSIGAVVLAMARTAPGFSDALAASGSQIIASMLGQVEGGSEEHLHGLSNESELALSRRLKAELFIDGNLGADLTADMIAHRIGVSRSSLYRAFQATGGIEATITKRRAARLRSLILRPGEGRLIAVLAQQLGFSDPSHCSRAFRQIYGQSPNQLRASLSDNGHSGSRTLHVDRMQHWYRVMNDRPVDHR